jgi:arsenate reductase-like glutaredoxin family protein
MTIQVFGTKKCKETAKAVRFFKERKIDIHIVDITEKGISEGEFNNIFRSVAPEDLIDRDGREYEKNNLKYIQHNEKEVLLENPLLVRTPIVRNGNRATAGYTPEIWTKWMAVK